MSVVTDEIERFNDSGIPVKSGKQLDADIIVAATGFNINVLGDITFSVDGKPLMFADGHLSGDDVYWLAQSGLGIRLLPRELDAALRHGRRLRVQASQAHGQDRCEQLTVALRSEDQDMPLLPWVEPESFNPGYILRDASSAQAGRQAAMAA